jgi:hypothetical protein
MVLRQTTVITTLHEMGTIDGNDAVMSIGLCDHIFVHIDFWRRVRCFSRRHRRLRLCHSWTCCLCL